MTPTPEALAHVRWIGGPPDCGKTTVAANLAARFQLPAYHVDRHEPAHFARATPAATPALWAAHPDRMTSEQRWLGSSPKLMARDTIAAWSKRFAMALDDLLALPADRTVIAEGPGFFPDLVAPLIDDPRRAIWLVPTDAFKRLAVARRGKPGSRHETSDPARATAAHHGLTVIEIDGRETIEMIAARVAAHFAPWLPRTSS